MARVRMTALELTAQCIAGHGWHVVRNGVPWWVEGGHWRKLWKAIELHGPVDVAVSAVPCLDLGSMRVRGESSVLWVRCESRDSCKRLARFKPEPTIVLREGGTVRQVALWSLTRPCPGEKLEEANGRLSYALACKLKFGTAGFEFAPPGTVIRAGRKRGVPVVAAGGSGEPVPAGRLLGGLKKRPDPPDWLGRQS